MRDDTTNDLRMPTGTRRARELLRAALRSALKRSSHDAGHAAHVTRALASVHQAALGGAAAPEALVRAARDLLHGDDEAPPIDGDARAAIQAWIDAHEVTQIALVPRRSRRRVPISATKRAVLLPS